MPLPRRLALVALLPVLLTACDSPTPPPVELGVPWALAEHRQRTLSELSYHFELDIPAGRGDPIQGRAHIEFDRHDPDGFDLVLDFMSPRERVRSVLANGVEVVWSAVEDHVVIPAASLAEGRNQVEVAFKAGDEALNRNEDFLYSLFVPDRAHFSLPVFDQPNLKGTVAWSLRVPAGWEAVANGAPGETVDAPEGRTLEFLPSKPIPTYLFAFAAGAFSVEESVVDGRAMRMYHRETDTVKLARNRDAVFRLHGDALAWLEEYTAIPYPFDTFAFVLVPSFQYGGMEHPGAIFYNASGLILDESATQDEILGRASVIAHETAHMWFGDLVTMNWFDDVWTKEVFAGFMAAKIVHPSFPDVDHALRFLTTNHPAAYGVDRTQGANPIRQPLDNLREAGTLYGAIIYQKAPIVMKQLEARVGESAFRDGIREYLSAHAYGNATWPDLVAVLDRLSPEDLTAWSRVWVEERGRPVVTVSREGADVVITQADPAGRGRVWPQSLQVRVGREAGDTLVAVELGEAPARLGGMGGADVRFVLPNGSGVEYGLFLLDTASLAYLADSLPALEPGLARGAAWVTLWDQVLEQRLPPGPFVDLVLAAIPRERDELALGRALGYLSSAWWSLLPDSVRAARAEEVERVLWEGVTSDRPRTARSALLGAWRGMALTPASVARMERLWRGTETVPGIPLSEADQTALATALAVRGVEGWLGILDEQEERIDNPDRRARFRFVRPSLDADPAVRLAFFDSLRDPANREREPWVLSGLENLHHPIRARSALPTVRPALDMVEEVQRTGDIFFPGRWLDATLARHTEPEAADEVRRFLGERPDLAPRLRAKVLQSADPLWRAAAILHGWR
ncbi:MAG TPA: M1 family aminopeptidase [Longimicrobiales bacterium]|nr:M1 family aminopeptidase [Longimicrobiales bacterium]